MRFSNICNFLRAFLFLIVCALFSNIALANDSDIVNNLRPYKIVVLGSSTAYGTGASTYDSSWVGKYQQYLKIKNPLNEVVNLAIPGITTYNNLRPDNYISPSGRPSTIYGNNITAAINMHPDAIIINMPSNDAVNYYTLEEQKANVEAAIYLADSSNIPVWITTSQPRNNLNAEQMALLTGFRDWVLTRFGNKSVNFWNNVANANGSIADYYDYDAVHVNNLGHGLFFTRMKAACVLDSITSRQINVIAGNDTTLILPNNQFLLRGNVSSVNNGNINYSWTKISGPSIFTIQNENQIDATISNLVEGNYAFELMATDALSNIKKDTINIVVKTRILIDFGPTTTIGADVNGNYWNNITSGTEGIKLQNAITTNNLITSLGLQIINRVDGQFNLSGQGVNTGSTIGDIGDYPNSVTTDYAFAYFNTVLGKWKLTGLDSLKEYSVKFWGTRNATDFRVIEIKRADESVWKSYEAANNTNYNNAAIFTIRGKSEMTFDIKTPAYSSFGHICLLDITRRTPADINNLPPTAIAGNDVNITLPINTVQLDGNQSFDNDQTITSFEWRKISGPLVYTLTNSNNAIANASGLEIGVYKFELKVTDSEGGTDLDTVVVNVGDRVLIDFGNTLTTSPDANGKYWNNVSSGTEGVKLINAFTVGNTTTNISLEVIGRIDGTFNTSGPGVNTGNTIGVVNDYPNSATTDFAFAHPSTTNGAWKISGLDSTKIYSIKFWGTRSVSDNREIEIKTSEDSIWKSYNALNNANYNNAVIIDIYGKSSVVFNIRVKTGSAFGHISLMDISFSKPCIVTNSTTNTIICKSQLPYTWNNKNYNSAGTYNAFLINSNGCDSIATLNLIVNDSTFGISNVSICANQTPFVWNGNDYSNSGVYSVTLANVNGCDSLATLNLIVNDLSESITNKTICDYQTPFVWNGNNYYTSGTFSVTLSNVNGCDSVATLNLTINNTSSSVTNVSICSNQTPYVWNGNNYYTSGTFSVTLSNANGCDSIATLNLIVNNTSSSVTNIIICSNQTPFVWNGNDYTTSGNYSITLLNENGCDSIATLNLVVNELSESTTIITICSNQTPYVWNGNNYYTSGTYSVTLSNANGCDSITYLNLTVKNTSSSVTNITICANQSPYVWNGNNYNTSGTYSVTRTNAKGCDSIATLNLIINALPIVSAGTYNNVSVLETSLPLIGSPIGGTFSGTSVLNNTFRPSIAGLGTFNIAYTYTNPVTGCTNTANTTITVTCNFTVAATIIGSNNACLNTTVGDSAVYSISTTDATTYTWSVSNATTMKISNNKTNSSVNVLYTTAFTTGTITVIVKGCNGTTITKTLNITKTAPTAPVTTAGSRCGSGSVLLSAALVSGTTINWYSAATAGTLLATSTNNFNTPIITANTTYYAQAIIGICLSATRTATIATINALPTVVTTFANVTKCKTDTASITATAAAGLTIDWYADSTTSTVLQRGTATGVNKLITPQLSATTLYWAVQRNLTTGCRSAERKRITVFVYAAPAAPSATGATRCGTGTVVLNATVPTNPVGTLAWYNLATGGTSVATTASYTTPSITASTTYYVESKTTSTGCASLTRTPVLATINALPAVPVAVAGTGCTGSRITISGTVSTGQTIDWYSAANAGTLLLSNSLSYTTPVITANTNYYATARNTTTSCVSATRTTVAATVNAVLAAPTSLTGLISICPIVGTSTGTTYTATSVKGANSYFWTVPRGAVIDSGSIGLKIKVRYITASANDTISVQANNGCIGAKRSVRLTTTGCATTAIAKVSNIQSDETDIKTNFFPNPTSTEFNLNINSTKDEKIKVIVKDIQGRTLKNLLLNTNQNNAIGKELKPGVYFLEIHLLNKIKVIRAVKS